MCHAESWTQNAVIRHRVLVIRRQMIECYRKGKKERGNIKSLWKENKTVMGKLPASETRICVLMTLWRIQVHQAFLAATCVLGKECGLPSATTPKTVAYSTSPLTLWGSAGTLDAERKGKAFCERLHRSSLAEAFGFFFFFSKNPALAPQHSKTPMSLQTTWENVDSTKDSQLIKGRLETDITVLVKYLKG